MVNRSNRDRLEEWPLLWPKPWHQVTNKSIEENLKQKNNGLIWPKSGHQRRDTNRTHNRLPIPVVGLVIFRCARQWARWIVTKHQLQTTTFYWPLSGNKSETNRNDRTTNSWHTHNQHIITTKMIVDTDDHFWPTNSGFPPNYHNHDPIDNLPDEPSTITICDHPCLSNNDNILHTRKWPPWPLVSGVTRR